MSKLMERSEAVSYLTSEYFLTYLEAMNLLDRARENASGMAKHERHLMRDVWATHMTTQGGKFIIELATQGETQ